MNPQISRNSFTIRVREWATLGFVVGCLYALYVVVLYVIRGAAPFERVGITLPKIVAAYLCTGPVAGAVIGALHPLTRRLAGLIFVAILAAFTAAVGVGISMYGFVGQWSERHWLQMILSALLLGAITGVLLWSARTPPGP